jgi:hypothetical protein
VFCRPEGGEQRKALLLIVSFVVEYSAYLPVKNIL